MAHNVDDDAGDHGYYESSLTIADKDGDWIELYTRDDDYAKQIEIDSESKDGDDGSAVYIAPENAWALREWLNDLPEKFFQAPEEESFCLLDDDGDWWVWSAGYWRPFGPDGLSAFSDFSDWEQIGGIDSGEPELPFWSDGDRVDALSRQTGLLGCAWVRRGGSWCWADASGGSAGDEEMARYVRDGLSATTWVIRYRANEDSSRISHGADSRRSGIGNNA